MINKERIRKEFLELIQIRCSTHDEREIGDLLTKRLQELGGTVKEDQAGEKLGGNCGNLVADFPATAGMEKVPTVMLTAHMDCVEPCAGIHPIIENGIIRSDGTTILGSDDKAGVTAILEALRQLREQGLPHGPLQVVFTISEENGVHGSQNLDSSLLHADMGFTLDTHGHPGVMSYKAPGKNQIHIHIAGKAAHAGVEPEKGINAIVAAGTLLADAPQGRIDVETTCNVGRIAGGSATNVVADSCDVYYESRSRDKKKLEEITQRIVDHFKRGEKTTGCHITAEVSPDYGPYEIPQDAPAIEVASRAAKKLGFPLELEESGGGSDANHFNTYGVPTVVLGVGMTNCHTKEEYIEEKDLYDSAEWALAIVLEAAKETK
ncbi:M20/M25/M40 family metallo-hydrolase [uncultured Mitsuokella sp.]|uniref:M20/M25/M40 family metallo-hydrolase n=1 Tax=uncultured Mitsuokella sp. TaxID=453120 RepID=UPI0025D96472|nr:M20/M25/M40 family metallo-hydrolase [uncultured Mitsuokella sp.]